MTLSRADCVLSTGIFHLLKVPGSDRCRLSKRDEGELRRVLDAIPGSPARLVIALGDGTASRHTAVLLADLIASDFFRPFDADYW